MKKLILYDHTGEKQAEHDVFVEGSDFKWEADRPTAMWFGKILLVDKEPEPEEPKLETDIVELTPEALEAMEEAERQGIDADYEAMKADIGEVEVAEAEVPFITPTSITETIQEQEEKVEPEITDDKSAGDEGISPADASEDTEKVPEVRKHRKAIKTDKRHKQPKSA